jgi:PAS domain S-box-containing protein
LDEDTFEEKLSLILQQAVELLGGRAGVIALWDEASRKFVDQASFGLTPDAQRRLRPLLDEAIPDLAGSREGVDQLADLTPGVRIPSLSADIGQDFIIALPLQIGGRATGLIYILRPSSAQVFPGVDRRILAVFADQAAIAVQNARLAHLLAEEKGRVESVLENSGEGILNIDAQGSITAFNAAMERLTGWRRQDVLGQSCRQVLSPRDRQGRVLCNVQCPMAMGLAENRLVMELEGTIVSKEGRPKDVGLTYSLVISPRGELMDAVVNCRDITRIRELENLRSVFLSIVSHELQTPIAIIKGYADTLARPDAQWDQMTLAQGLQAIEEESDRLSKLVGNLLYASRIESGSLELSKGPVDLPGLARKVVRRLHTRGLGHEFVVHFTPNFPAVYADEEKLEEVFTNLLDNAIKYSPKGGTISVTGHSDGYRASVRVSDEGVGIASLEKGKVFDRFYRVEGMIAHQTQGVGLGLFICRAIVRAHDGEITVESEAGKGTTFTFVLPVGKPEGD